MSGYVEFAFDSAEKVADASSYFPVFFHFDRTLNEVGFDDRVHFHWELMGAEFIRSKVSGFTITVTVNTDWYATAGEAGTAWTNALDLLSDYLAHWPPTGGASLFSNEMDVR